MTEEKNKIELRSEEVQEILGHIPSRLIRYGITAMLSIVVLLFVGSFFFEYPDILTAPAEIVTINPPATIIARSSGNLTQLMVSDTQQVTTQQVLGVIQNSAKYSAVIQLNNWIKANPSDSLPKLSWGTLANNLSLGEIQNTYSAFLKTHQAYDNFIQLDYYPNKNQALKIKVLELGQYLQLMQKQVSLKTEDFKLSQSQYQRDSLLYTKEVISKADLEKSQKNIIQENMALQNTRAQAINTSMQLNDSKQQILDNQLQHTEQINNYHNQLDEQYSQLRSRLAWWFDTYALQSPIDGKIVFNQVWSTNQYLNSGDEVFTIIPNKESQKIARVQLPVLGAGKVKKGQHVNLKFEQYPYQEFGMVQAVVKNRTKVQAKSIYTVELALSDTLITNYGITIPFSQRMLATAEIITEDLPLIARLFNPLKAILKNHWGNTSTKKADQ